MGQTGRLRIKSLPRRLLLEKEGTRRYGLKPRKLANNPNYG